MGSLPINHKYVSQIILSALICGSLIFFIVSNTWITKIIYVPMSQYVPMSHYVPISQYIPPMMKVNIKNLLTHRNQVHLISPQMSGNKSQLSYGTSQKYHTSFRPKKVYFPGDPLPEKELDAIRKLSDSKLKRRLTYKQYDVLKNMLEEVVQIFKKNDIRYTLTTYHFHKIFNW